MRVCLFEDRSVVELGPLVLTRAAFDLRCGQTTLAAKQCHIFPNQQLGAVVRYGLAELCRFYHPEMIVNDPAWLRAGPAVLVNSRWLPSMDRACKYSEPSIGLIGNDIAYVVLDQQHLSSCAPETLQDSLEAWKRSLPHHHAGGCLVRYPWDLIQHNAEQLCSDFRYFTPNSDVSDNLSSVTLIGPSAQLRIDSTARIEPLVVVDTSRGPVTIDRDAAVAAFSRLEGPCYIGPGTHVLGAKVREGTTLGPHCRVGGEIEASIVHGYSNKYHDGFLGHSYLGEWINLGAGTQSSDLRNDYGEVTVILQGQKVPTGMTKVGCFLGDHTKTGLGTLLNTGTNVGIFCNLLPSGQLLPKYIPSFCRWWNGSLAETTDLPRLLHTATEVMRRRDVQFAEVHAGLFRTLFDQTAPERVRALQAEKFS